MTIDRTALASSIEQTFHAEGLEPSRVEEKIYPEETIYVVYVDDDEIELAGKIGNAIDRELETLGLNAFVVARRTPKESRPSARPLTQGVQDERSTRLTQLITARSRTSEVQPSLSYVRDSSGTLASATANTPYPDLR